MSQESSENVPLQITTVLRRILASFAIAAFACSCSGPILPDTKAAIPPTPPIVPGGNLPTPNTRLYDNLPVNFDAPIKDLNESLGEYCELLENRMIQMGQVGEGVLTFSPNAYSVLGDEITASLYDTLYRYDQVASPECRIGFHNPMIITLAPEEGLGQNTLARVNRSTVECDNDTLSRVPIMVDPVKIEQSAGKDGIPVIETYEFVIPHEFAHACGRVFKLTEVDTDVVPVTMYTRDPSNLFITTTPVKPRHLFTKGNYVIGIAGRLPSEDDYTSIVFEELRADFYVLMMEAGEDLAGYADLKEIPDDIKNKMSFFMYLLAFDSTLQDYGYKFPPKTLAEIFIEAYDTDNPIYNISLKLGELANNDVKTDNLKTILYSYAMANRINN